MAKKINKKTAITEKKVIKTKTPVAKKITLKKGELMPFDDLINEIFRFNRG